MKIFALTFRYMTILFCIFILTRILRKLAMFPALFNINTLPCDISTVYQVMLQYILVWQKNTTFGKPVKVICNAK